MEVLDKVERFEVKVQVPGARMEDTGGPDEGNSGFDFRQMKEEKEVKEGDRVLHAERSLTS